MSDDPFGVNDPSPDVTLARDAAELVRVESLDTLIPLGPLAAAVDVAISPLREKLAFLVTAWSTRATIANDDDAVRAEEALKVAATLKAEAADRLKPIKEWFHVRHKAVTAGEASIDAEKAKLDGLLRQNLGAYQLRKRQAEAERERINREAAELDRRTRAEQEERARLAAGASAQEAAQARQEVAQAPLVLPPVSVTPGAKASPRVPWKARLVSLPDLIVHVAALIQAGDLSQVALLDYVEARGNDLAKVQREHFSVPGLVAEQTIGVTIRKGAKSS